MAQIPSLDDVALGVSLLARRGVEAVIATVSWSFAAAALANLWGFTRVRGVDLEVDDATGRFTGRVSRHCEPEDKVTFAAEQCERLGVGLNQVVAIGDGRADLPLFRSVGFSVAINASSEVQAAASAAVETQSLLDALTAVPGLLDQSLYPPGVSDRQADGRPGEVPWPTEVSPMMWYWSGGMHWWGWLLGSTGMVVFWGLLVWAIWYVVTAFARLSRHDHGAQGHHDQGDVGAREVLDRRLAHGEIDADEYRRLRDLIDSGGRQ